MIDREIFAKTLGNVAGQIDVLLGAVMQLGFTEADKELIRSKLEDQIVFRENQIREQLGLPGLAAISPPEDDSRWPDTVSLNDDF